jgi:hypothetical protein
MSQGLPQAQSLLAVIDNFFAQPDLPVKIRLLEKKVRHDTLMWIAWYLYYTGHSEKMVQYLKQAWQYKSYPSVATIINWSESFAQFSQHWEEKTNNNSPTILPSWQNLFEWIITQF